MKNKKIIPATLVSFLLIAFCFTTNGLSAQTKKDSVMMKDCCMMKDGKMMCMKNGKTMPMDRDMTMKNGAKCMKNGECIMKDGKKMKMKEGDCMDMNGKMDKCEKMNKNTKSSTEMRTEKQEASIVYTCSMHPEVTSDMPANVPNAEWH